MNLAELAQKAVIHLRPELLLLAGKAVEGAASESGKQLLSWLQERFHGKPAETALADAAGNPDDDLRLESLKSQIQILIRDDDTYRQQLEALLAASPQNSSTQVASATGGSKIAQVSGSENKISIR